MTLLYPLDASLDPKVRLQLLGRKAAGLHEMTALGVPVPPGFTLTTEVGAVLRRDGVWPDGLEQSVAEAMAALEQRVGRRFGDPTNPLLVAVRSGAPVSMPGMMDTLLNVGLNDESLPGLTQRHGSEWFALDAYRRLIEMYGTVVRRVGADRFQFRLGALKTELGAPRMSDSEVPVDAMRSLVTSYLELVEEASGSPFPQDARTQLWDAIRAVFLSWYNARAVRYRRIQGIDRKLGTACTVQAMVFGNTGPQSGSGVAFTRNPSNGERQLYGEYLPNAQGEDVVAGLRTPVALTAQAATPGKESTSLERALPDAFKAVSEHCATLERHFADVQDVEFTIEDGTPYILQTRSAKRTARAAVRIAVAMVDEGLLTEEQALTRVDASSLEQLHQARLPPSAELAADGIHQAARGLPAGPGAASGRIVFQAADAVRWASAGHEVILVRQETSAEDIHGMQVAAGVLTATGGMTSHAAVVARGLGRCCVVGCGDLDIDGDAGRVRVASDTGSTELAQGDWMTIDGSTGDVYVGALDLVAAPTVAELDVLMSWADGARRMRVYAEADTPQAARTALSYGAQGVGLCRTERMFAAPTRLFAMQCALLSVEAEQRSHWLSELQEAQRQDFVEMFRAMDGRPVTIRLLDRALEEFLPQDVDTQQTVADALDLELGEVQAASEHHRESNPAFGHRGVRAGLTVPGLYDMQLRAMLYAARDCIDGGIRVELEILVPMVAFTSEIVALRTALGRVEREVFETPDPRFVRRVGAMIELPRACLLAGDLARHAEVFSFGGNDLTQTVLGVSRDDASRFLPTYRNDLGLMSGDPFTALDSQVVEMMSLALQRARAVNPSIIAGLCGDMGGNPPSIEACERLGLHFVSAPLPQLPGARLAAAQARIRQESGC